MRSVVIVGASLAGLGTAAALRRVGFDGEITLIDAAEHMPVDRPPLTKQVLRGDWPIERAEQPAAATLDSLNVDLRLGTRVLGFDLDSRTLSLAPSAGGSHNTSTEKSTRTASLHAEGLVIASGAHPRPLPAPWATFEGLHTIRDRHDTGQLLADLNGYDGPVLVVGAGVIGLEAAASLASTGREVIVVEPQTLPMMRAVPPLVAERLVEVHRSHGVDLRLGTGIDRFFAAPGAGSGRIAGATLTDGSTVTAGVSIVGIGVTPSSAWLQGSGVPLDDSGAVICDSTCQAAPGVWAAGDIASYVNSRFDERMRVEHWDHALEMGAYLGRRILAEAPEDFAPVPYFWSDQYDVKLQMAGRYRDGDEMVVLDGDPEQERFVLGFRRGDRLGSVVGLNRPAAVIRWRTKMSTPDGVQWHDL